MIRSVRDIALAFDEGRWHSQRFVKNAGQIGDGQWQDWAYASGQPAYDARIGNALARTPMVAAKNDAIWFPPIAAGHTRHLAEMRVFTTPGGLDQTSVEFQAYDLVAVYPLIDGDSTDLQSMDNAAALPRYADGLGLRAVLVNHVAPAVSIGSVTIDYTDADLTARSMTVTATTYGPGKAAWTLDVAGTSGPLFLPTAGRGLTAITGATFLTPPGGLWCIYLLRPLPSIAFRGGATGATQSVWTEKSMATQDAWHLPRIYDGAHLGFFYLPTGGARTVALVGSAQFIWG